MILPGVSTIEKDGVDPGNIAYFSGLACSARLAYFLIFLLWPVNHTIWFSSWNGFHAVSRSRKV